MNAPKAIRLGVRNVRSAGVYLQSTLAAVWYAGGCSRVAESETSGRRGMVSCPNATHTTTPP